MRSTRGRAPERGVSAEIGRARAAYGRAGRAHPRRSLRHDADRGHGALRHRHRGGVREPGGEARGPGAARRRLRAARDLRFQHLDLVDHRARRGVGARGPFRRHAFLPAGAADEARRDVAGPQDERRGIRRRVALLRGDGPAAGEDQGQAGLHPQRAAGAASTTTRSASSRPASPRPPTSTAR